MSDAVIEPTERTRVRRRSQRGHYERAVIDAILDEAFVCHVGFADGGKAFVTPTAYARYGDHLYLHGSAANRTYRALRDGADACICVTLIDGLVLARSAFHHSINYRSVILYGRATEVSGEQEKAEAFTWILDHIVPQRRADVRTPTPQEIKQTIVLRFPIVEASAKVRSGPPIDDEEDLQIPCWAGVIPLRLVAGVPQAAPELSQNTPAPRYVSAYQRD